MVLHKVGIRTVDILVNGTQQDSFQQKADRADYDVDVSSSANVEQSYADSVTLNSGAPSYYILYKDNDSSTGWVGFAAQTITWDEFRIAVRNNDNTDLLDVQVKDNGGSYLYNVECGTNTSVDSGWTATSNGVELMRLYDQGNGWNGAPLDIEWGLRGTADNSSITINGVTKS